MPHTDKNKVVIVTGLSGAGMTAVLKTFEDFGYEVFDNFPLTLVKSLVKQTKKGRPVAIGIDTRSRGFSTNTVLKKVEALGATLLFITCDAAVLQKRFSETRRRHPLAKDKPASTGIRKERKKLETLKTKAALTIDTSELSIHDLRHILEGHFAIRRKSGRLVVTLISFAFRNGVPREADIVMDVRFAKNPHWVKSLKRKTGIDKPVGDYIKKDPQWNPFLKNFKSLLKPLLPRYAEEGKSYLTIAVGCSGGRHRSVFAARELGAWLKDMGYTAHIEHRDIRK
ncbi:MAG: RNase adapter RapZ [Alphaproteobacteria bacterium PRO2]|nr:RNase adapter RapZ [Alphaproteobacteria bacterium PRO2]